jgi:hypothetical protein
MILGWLFGVLVLRGQVTTQDKADPVSFPVVVRSAPTAMKPKIMSLVVDVKGENNRFVSDEGAFSLIPGRLIPSKGLMSVPPESRVIFRPMPGITTLIDADTRVQLKGLDVVKRGDKITKRKAVLYLNEGSVFTSIQKMNSKTTTYEIQTPQAVAGAKGTKFWVSYRNGQGKVGVINGVVEVKLTNGIKISLKQNEFLELKGVGSELKSGSVRVPSDEEVKTSESASESVSAVEGVTAAAANPFLTTSEATQRKVDDLTDTLTSKVIQDAVEAIQEAITNSNATANTNNTSTNTVVSPVGP